MHWHLPFSSTVWLIARRSAQTPARTRVQTLGAPHVVLGGNSSVLRVSTDAVQGHHRRKDRQAKR